MYLLEITFENGVKQVFKTRRQTKNTSCIQTLSPSILKGDRINELHTHGYLKCSFEYYGCKEVKETKIDGRKLEYKGLKWFSFIYCFENILK